MSASGGDTVPEPDGLTQVERLGGHPASALAPARVVWSVIVMFSVVFVLFAAGTAIYVSLTVAANNHKFCEVVNYDLQAASPLPAGSSADARARNAHYRKVMSDLSKGLGCT